MFQVEGLNGKKAKKLLAGMTKTAPACAFGVVSTDKKGTTLFAACGKECDEKLKSAKDWTAAAFPEGKGGGKDDFASKSGKADPADLIAKATAFAETSLQWIKNQKEKNLILVLHVRSTKYKVATLPGS